MSRQRIFAISGITVAILLIIAVLIWTRPVSTSASGVDTTTTTTTSSALVGKPLPFMAAYNLSGHLVTLQITKPTVIEFIANWCMYCAWESKWQDNAFIKHIQQEGGQVILLNGDPASTIGVAGPETQPTLGHDGSNTSFLKAPASVAITNKYASIYHLPTSDLYVAPNAQLGQTLSVDAIPDFIFVNASGTVTDVTSGTQSSASILQLWKAYH